MTAVAGRKPAAAVMLFGTPKALMGNFGLAMAKKALPPRLWRRRGDSA